MKKKRSHNLEELSENALRDLVTKKNWIVRKKEKDYGIDFELQIVDTDENVTEKTISIQLKSTDSVFLNDNVKLKNMNTENMKDYEKHWLPVFILLWVESKKCFYYIFVQRYIKEVLDKENSNWRKQKTITISKMEFLDFDLIEELSLEGYKYIISNYIGIPYNVDSAFYWHDGVLKTDNNEIKEHAIKINLLMREYKFDNALKEISKMRIKYTLSFKERLSLCTYEGAIQIQKHDFGKSLETYKSVLEMIEIDNMSDLKAGVLGNMGIAYRILGKNDVAESLFIESIQLFEKSDIRFLANVQNNLGILYKNMMKFEKALDLYFDALKNYREAKDNYSEGVVLGNIGVVYRRKGDYSNALKYTQESIDISMHHNNKLSLSDQYGNKGLIYNEQKEYDLAIESLEKSLEIKNEISDQKGIGLSHGNIGKTLMNKGDYVLAENELKKSLDILEGIGYKQGTGEMLYNLGLTEYYSGKNAEARLHMDRAFKIFDEIGNETLKTQIKGFIYHYLKI
ncbi:Tetratricopeptide repeat-containing protein [Paenibacillus sp. ov031]|uniref:tetratricopeptide repeat protein n=1 Tax=Paenibacillus sp. ov031 TaxID=1761879 RepID=UPI000919E2F5|nr:tetratricopeptide repeat protein [Paenibacillus sp. ov031]SHN73318.1 Tetratricopeptide repeat-containing protein [Paenibacillus sp. ov031]